MQEDWKWTEKYATQPEILKYANHVADRFKLREHISFNTEVKSATFNEERNIWELKDHDNKLIKSSGSTIDKKNISGYISESFKDKHFWKTCIILSLLFFGIEILLLKLIKT